MANKLPVPTESEEQIALFEWAQLMQNKHPELELLHHIPNGGKRPIGVARKLKTEGTKSGLPDICFPVPWGNCHGLYIELKRTKGSSISDPQKWWIEQLNIQGYLAIFCYGWEDARKVILNYLKFEIRESVGRINGD